MASCSGLNHSMEGPYVALPGLSGMTLSSTEVGLGAVLEK